MSSRSLVAFLLAASFLVPLAIPGEASADVLVQPFEDVTDPAIPGNQVDPRAVVFGDAVHLFWSGRDYLGDEGPDSDIYHAAYDGEWSEPEVITSGTDGNDETPFPVVHDSDLYLFWSSDDDNTTGAEKRNIVVSNFSGTSWSNPVCISSALRDEGAYDPFAIVHDGDLWVFYEAWSAESSSYEIACARNDGSWRTPVELTSGSDGWNTNPCARRGTDLIVAWQSADSTLNGGLGGTVIASRVYDAGWSGVSLLSPADGSHNMEPCFAGGFIFWLSDSPDITSGGDTDVVCRVMSNGDWSDEVYELTAGDDGEDGCLSAAYTSAGTVICWVTDGAPGVGGDTDVVFSRTPPGIYRVGDFTEPVLISVDDTVNDGGGPTQKAPAIVEWHSVMFIWEANAAPTLGGQPSKTWIRSATVLVEDPTYEGALRYDPMVFFVVTGFVVAATASVLLFIYFRPRRG